MQAAEIHTENWQMDVKTPDNVVLGNDDIRQCIDVILTTRKGEDPLRPHFGCDLWKWIDAPVNSAIPNMKKSMLDSLSEYEKRIKIIGIKSEIIDLSRVLFYIDYKAEAGGDINTFSFEIGGSAGEQPKPILALSAKYEDGAFRYQIVMQLNGEDANPAPPASGFASISDLMNWVNDNWYIFGTWHHISSQNTVVAYIKGDVATSGNLNIVSSKNTLSSVIPTISNDERYMIILKDSNGRISPWDDDNIASIGGILMYVQSNYGHLGEWSIDGQWLILNGSVDLSGYSLDIQVTSTVAAFSAGFNKSFES